MIACYDTEIKTAYFLNELFCAFLQTPSNNEYELKIITVHGT